MDTITTFMTLGQIIAAGGTWKKELITWANERNVYAKSAGLLEENVQNVY